jgi:ribose transport system ATP-binding protein
MNGSKINTKKQPLLEIRSVTKYYGGHRALNNVSFDLYAGEVLCIVGENGAGKSTLIKVISGAIMSDAGTIHIQGTSYQVLHPRQSMELGLATIYQDVELIDSLTVADNIFLGDEYRSRFGLFVDAVKQNEKAREILDILHIDIDEKMMVEDLSAAQKQTLQIVKALRRESRVLIMDEPTSSLGYEETRSLMDLIGRLKSKGIGIIYISHYLEEVFEIGDRVLVLKDGEYVGTYNREDVDPDFIMRKMVGRDASVFFSRKRTPIGKPYAIIKNMNWNNRVVDVSFNVRRGEIFGIGGLVGSGRTELASLVYGTVSRDSGEVILDETPVNIRKPEDAIRNGICLITEDRHKYGLFDERSVIENITIAHHQKAGRPLISPAKDRQLADRMIEKLDIVLEDGSQVVTSLSGGNQQKTIVSRWLLDEFMLYIFDEPTKGVDVGAKQQIYRLMENLVGEKKCVIMVSSDMPELISMSDRIGIMRNGSMVRIIENRDISEEELIKYFIEG